MLHSQLILLVYDINGLMLSARFSCGFFVFGVWNLTYIADLLTLWVCCALRVYNLFFRRNAVISLSSPFFAQAVSNKSWFALILQQRQHTHTNHHHRHHLPSSLLSHRFVYHIAMSFFFLGLTPFVPHFRNFAVFSFSRYSCLLLFCLLDPNVRWNWQFSVQLEAAILHHICYHVSSSSSGFVNGSLAFL